MRFRRRPPSARVAAVFRKKSVEVEAVRIDKGEYLDTLEGRMHGSPGDWKITGVEGEQWFIKPNIFKQTYEPADDEAKKEWDAAYGEVTKKAESSAYRYDRRMP